MRQPQMGVDGGVMVVEVTNSRQGTAEEPEITTVCKQKEEKRGARSECSAELEQLSDRNAERVKKNED